MKYLLLIISLSIGSLVCAQTDEDCATRLQQAKGSWRKLTITNRASVADAVREKQFLDALHKMFQAYTPQQLTAEPFYSMPPARSDEPVNNYFYTLRVFHFSCVGKQLEVSEETATKLNINFNFFNETTLYDTSTDTQLSGYFNLRHGLPTEIRPGIWQFPDDPESLGFGQTGNSKLWLISIDGKVPWTYITRKEFLLKRKINLAAMLPGEEDHLQEQLNKWELEKKEKEKEYQGNPDKLRKYLDNTYQPGVEREKQNYKRAVEALTRAIEKVNEQLAAPGLDQRAIVIKNQQSLYDYDFTDKVTPFAEVLTKPNPAYFDRKVPRSVPQFISIEIIYDHSDPVDQLFAKSMVDLLNLDYLKSFIGKLAPGTGMH